MNKHSNHGYKDIHCGAFRVVGCVFPGDNRALVQAVEVSRTHWWKQRHHGLQAPEFCYLSRAAVERSPHPCVSSCLQLKLFCKPTVCQTLLDASSLLAQYVELFFTFKLRKEGIWCEGTHKRRKCDHYESESTRYIQSNTTAILLQSVVPHQVHLPAFRAGPPAICNTACYSLNTYISSHPVIHSQWRSIAIFNCNLIQIWRH